MAERNRTVTSSTIVWVAACVFLWKQLLTGDVWAWFSFGLYTVVYAKWAVDKLVLFKYGPAVK